MTIYEYVETLLRVKNSKILENDITPPGNDWESAAFEAAQLVSGSFTYRLYETFWLSGFPMEAATSHLEAMYDKSDFHGFLYFLVLLADSIDFTFPPQFYEMSMQDNMVPPLSAAIIEDWLAYDNEYEEIEEDQTE
jgi:hypothetical protein